MWRCDLLVSVRELLIVVVAPLVIRELGSRPTLGGYSYIHGIRSGGDRCQETRKCEQK